METEKQVDSEKTLADAINELKICEAPVMECKHGRAYFACVFLAGYLVSFLVTTTLILLKAQGKI